MLSRILKKAVTNFKSIQKSIEQCDKDEYTVGYYNGLEYAISILTNEEPCYKIVDKKEENKGVKRCESGLTRGGIIIRKGGA